MHRKIVPLKAWHLEWLNDASEPGWKPECPASVIEQIEETGLAVTGVVDGEVMFCVGATRLWQNRYVAWALLSSKSGPHMAWITRFVRSELDKISGRIEMTVRSDFSLGQRWARLLGFEIETPILKRFGPEGEDHVGYVRIN